MDDRVMTSWRWLFEGAHNQAGYAKTRGAELLYVHAREECQLDVWEDDDGMVTLQKPATTLDLPVLVQMALS